MPCIILGFHRSGTSMVARLLNQSGLYLGPMEAIMPPILDDNPEGYWEHLSVVDINDQILAIGGGTWRIPVSFDGQWVELPEIQSLIPKARSIFAKYLEPWGWKDPRTMVTLKFWLESFPEARLLLVLRNPLEIVQSLGTGKAMRDLSANEAIDLWLHYHKEMLKVVSIEQVVVTHYESFFYDPVHELQRVVDLLGITASSNTVIEACSSIKTPLKHHSAPETAIDLLLEPEVGHLYRQFAARAGDTYTKFIGDADYQERRQESYLFNLYQRLQLEQDRLGALQRQHSSVEEVNFLKQSFIEAVRYIDSLKTVLQARDEELASLKPIYAEAVRYIDSLKTVLQARDEELASLKSILNSRTKSSK